MLDFWLGTWRVCSHEGEEVGRNVIEPSVGGAVVLEHWRGNAGDWGESLFFLDHATGAWEQVWAQPACVKRKTQDPAWTEGVRFVGTAFLADGRRLADRTTLTPLPDGRVRQVIEQLRDGVWIVSFDALYELVTACARSSAPSRGAGASAGSSPRA
jgi:hypothetical protein